MFFYDAWMVVVGVGVGVHANCSHPREVKAHARARERERGKGTVGDMLRVLEMFFAAPAAAQHVRRCGACAGHCALGKLWGFARQATAN